MMILMTTMQDKNGTALTVGDEIFDARYGWDLRIVQIGQYTDEPTAACRRANGNIVAYNANELRSVVKKPVILGVV